MDSASSSSNWSDRDDFDHAYPVQCCSCGIIIKEDDDGITLLQSISRAQKLHEITIPRGCIKRIRRLKIGGDVRQ